MSNAAGAVDWHDVGHIAGVVVVVVVNPGSGRAHCGESSHHWMDQGDGDVSGN